MSPTLQERSALGIARMTNDIRSSQNGHNNVGSRHRSASPIRSRQQTPLGTAAPVYPHNDDFDDEDFSNEFDMFHQPRPVLTPADGMRRDSRFMKRTEGLLMTTEHPPPSRHGQYTRKPAIISFDTLDPNKSFESTFKPPPIPLPPLDRNRFAMGYKGGDPFITTYSKTYTSELRNADRSYESHEGERHERSLDNATFAAKKILQEIGDKVRQKQGGRASLRRALKTYSHTSGNIITVDVHEMRAALRLFNLPVSLNQSFLLFDALGCGAEGEITWEKFELELDNAQMTWV